MFIITGASGHTGSAAAHALLAAGQPVTVVLRDEAKARPWRDRGAAVVIADLTDAAALTAALRGATGAYLMNPPAYASADPLADAQRTENALADAARAAELPHAVVLSSLGAASDGVGLIRTNGILEAAITTSGRPATFLRAASFMQNAAAMVATVREHGVFPSFWQPLERKGPQIDTGDIGVAVADLLIAGPPAGSRTIVDLAGPQDASPADVAAAFATALGKPVTPVAVPRDQWDATLANAGFRREVAEQFVAMYDGLNAGRVTFSPGVTTRRGTTTVEVAIARLVA